MARKIVFPDAPSSWEVLFNEERLSRLSAIGEFSLGICDDDPEPETLIERIGDAKGMISA